LVDCGPGDGSATPPAKKDPPKVEEDKETMVPPNVLTMMRVSGSTQIMPSDVTKIAMQRDGREKSIGVAKVCVSETGAVTQVSMIQSTKYPAYDAQLISGIRTWTYKPYAAKGRNVKVCGTVTFVYGMK
jgi:TonB family protein